MVVVVIDLLLTVLEQKSKVRLISEVSEFSYLASGEIRKLGDLGKIFLSFRNVLNFFYLNMIWNGGNCFHAFLDCFRASKYS